MQPVLNTPLSTGTPLAATAKIVAKWFVIGAACAWLSAALHSALDNPTRESHAGGGGGSPMQSSAINLPLVGTERWVASGSPDHVEHRWTTGTWDRRALSNFVVWLKVDDAEWKSLKEHEIVWAWEDGAQRKQPWPASRRLAYRSLGWPIPCFESWYTLEAGTVTSPKYQTAIGLPIGSYGRNAGDTALTPRLIPFVPRFPQVLLMSAIYGAVSFTLWRTIRPLVKHTLRPKTACQGCGYDCAGLPHGRPCPECGHHFSRSGSTPHFRVT